MMQIRRLTGEKVLLLLAFLLALGLRLLNLGSAPLSEHEATLALQAVDLARGVATLTSSQPGYTLVTGALFFSFGSSNALARLWPALAGSLILLLPLMLVPVFQHSLDSPRLGRVTGIVLAFALALDPVLIALSRQAGGQALALTFGLLTIGALLVRRPILAGAFAGLATLSGPALLPGLLALVLALVIFSYLHSIKTRQEVEESLERIFPLNGAGRRAFLISTSGLLLFFGTLFLLYPLSLAGIMQSWLAYLAGWSASSAIPALRLPVALFIYQPLAVTLGILGAVRSWFRGSGGTGNSGISRFLSLAFFIALGLAMLYPGRQVADANWALIFLWILAAIEISRHFGVSSDRTSLQITLGHALLLFVLFVFMGLTLLMLGRDHPLNDFELRKDAVYLRVLSGTGLMVGLTSALVALGWSWEISRRGLIWAFCAALSIYVLAGTWGLSQLRPGGSEELWSQSPSPGQVSLLSTTLGDLSEWRTGRKDALEIFSLSDSAALRWILRNREGVRYVSQLNREELPEVIIAPQGEELPQLSADYRGQDFVWSIYPDWQGILPPNPVHWLFARSTPLRQDQVILWARSDLFPSYQAQDSSSNQDENLTP